MILIQKCHKYRKNELHNQEQRLTEPMIITQNQRVRAIWILIFALATGGCVSEPGRTYKKEFVNTYAELTLVYEKQKIDKREIDSNYQVLVKEFFEKKGIHQDEFKKAAEELSQNPQVWKLFITDVTSAIDSIKSAEYNKIPE